MREVDVPTASPDRPEARMDLVVRAPTCAGQFHVDLTVVDAASREALQRGAADRDGAAAKVAADHKRRKYPNIDVIPFVLEDHGRLGADAVAFLQRVAPGDLQKRSQAMRDIYHALSATLQRHQADAIIAAIAPRAQRSHGAIVRTAEAAIGPPAARDVRQRP